MRLINFKLGDASEVASKHDFITAEEYESGASETVPGDRGGGYNLQGLLDTAHYGTDAATEEDSWQVDASDSASESSLSSPALAYCLNCSERRHGDVCETCGHDAAVDPLTVAPVVDYAWRRPDVDRDVAIVYDDRMTMHQKGNSSPHPERPDRLRAIMSRLLSSGLAARCKRIDCREATLEELLCVHSEQLVERNKQISDSVSMAPDNASLRLSADLYINKHTFQCAKLAAGGSAQVAAVVARKEASAGAAIVRPPGHHAESGNAMGFCFFNNAAVAARVAQRNGARKVMIVDWDVHHGNGTQNIFQDDPSVLYISLHRYDGGSFYPGTGGPTEVGSGQGKGFSVNIPWDYDGMGDEDYVAAFQHVVLPIASEFKPDMTIVSAGFDAAEGDPLGGCRVTPEGYGRLTAMLRPVAPLVLLLEGGYNLRATTMSTEACLRVLLGEELPASQSMSCPCPSPFAWLGIQQAIRVQCQYWTSLTSVADVANSWVGSPIRSLSSGLDWPNVMAGGPAPAPRAGSSSEPREGGLRGVPVRRRAPRGLLRGRRQVVGRRERLLKSDWRYKIILAIHNNAMKALWRRKRQLPRQQSLGSIGSMMELCSIGSSGSQQSLRSCPPNAVFDSANSGREKKMKRLHRFPSL